MRVSNRPIRAADGLLGVSLCGLVACGGLPSEVIDPGGGDSSTGVIGSTSTVPPPPPPDTTGILDGTGDASTTGSPRPDPSTGEPPTTGSTSVVGTDSSSSDGGESSSTGDVPGLVQRGILVRYFIDEAAAGKGVASLDDSTPVPLALPIEYSGPGGQPQFVDNGGNRGLEWFTESSHGMAATAIFGTKVESGLDNASQATIELVMDPDTVGAPGYTTRFIHLGGAFVPGRMTLGATTSQGFRFRMNDYTPMEWNMPVGSLGRVVVHLVFDASGGTPQERARLFIDGVEQVPTTVNGPAAGEVIDLFGTEELVLGNEPNSYRSMDGILYYAAVYTVALDDAEVAQNFALLSVSDDTQP